MALPANCTRAHALVARYYAGWTDKITGETLPAAAAGFFSYTRKVPIGVVGYVCFN